MSRVSVRSTLRMDGSFEPFPVNPTGLGGSLPPMGYFDPFGLAVGKDAATLRQYREAEIKHGRVCMLASAGLLTQEVSRMSSFPLVFALDISFNSPHCWDRVPRHRQELGEAVKNKASFIRMCSSEMRITLSRNKIVLGAFGVQRQSAFKPFDYV